MHIDPGWVAVISALSTFVGILAAIISHHMNERRKRRQHNEDHHTKNRNAL